MNDSTDYEVSRMFNRTTTKALTEARTTPVILVCIYNKNSTLITHELLHSVFSSYGKILRILIFEKVKVWKAFVEYASTEEAVEAKRNLNDFLLFNDGTRMNIYYSNLDSIKFQNNNSGGIDYTQIDEKDLIEFKGEFPLPVPQSDTNSQQENIQSFQQQYLTGGNGYEQFAERSTSNNSQSQPNSGQMKWDPESEEVDEEFLRSLNEQSREKDIPRYDPEPQQNEYDEYEKEQLIHKLLANAFPGSSQMSQYEKNKAQGLKLNSPPFNDPSQPQQPSMQNSVPFWPQQGGNAPPGLTFYPGSGHPSMQDPIYKPSESKLMRMPGSLQHIHLRQQESPHNTPPISRHATFQDLPNPSSLGGNPMGLQRPSTFTDLPKPNGLIKPQLSQFGSMSSLPKPTNPGYGNIGGMNQGPQMPQLNKPMLNPRFMSQPELPLASEISKYKLNELGSQNVADRIEGEILLRLMMNKFQNSEGNESNAGLINNLNDIKKFSPALSGLGDIEYDNLAQMNKGTLDEIYSQLSNLLGKSIDNKECAVLYVKGLEHKDIKVQMLYNIFSNFGNIKKIIFIRRQAAALIEYETVDYATKAKDYLNNIVFMGKPLRIYYSFHPIINLKNKKNGKDASEEIFIGTPKSFRFKKTKNISMNPPSSTLHISNLTKEMCGEDIIRNTFGQHGRIEAIQFKFMDNNRNMCLIRMASMEESLNAMSYLHDIDLGGRPIQISFTKSKI